VTIRIAEHFVQGGKHFQAVDIILITVLLDVPPISHVNIRTVYFVNIILSVKRNVG
jgi:hypothetical protein